VRSTQARSTTAGRRNTVSTPTDCRKTLTSATRGKTPERAFSTARSAPPGATSAKGGRTMSKLSPAQQAMMDALRECARGNASGEYWDRHLIVHGAAQHATARALQRRGLAVVLGRHVRPSADVQAIQTAVARMFA